jgi:hypothetical protein
VFVLLAALALRVGHLVALYDTPWFAHLDLDPAYYHRWAERIAAGQWLDPRAFYMDPTYPYVLGPLASLVGDGPARDPRLTARWPPSDMAAA